MRTVISASRRTDIPARYYDWLREGLRCGDVEVHFLDYVEVQPGVSAPLRIVIFSEDRRDDFRFQIIDGRVWLFDRSYSDGELRAH